MLRSLFLILALLVYMVWVVTLLICFTDQEGRIIELPVALAVFAWACGQWTIRFAPQLSRLLTEKAWKSLETRQQRLSNHYEEGVSAGDHHRQDIQVLDVQEHLDPTSALEFLSTKYGPDWQERPLLLKGLWTKEELTLSSRRLSTQGLLDMNLTIPFFTDARVHGALQPDAEAPVREIFSNISAGVPYKIGSQFIVQHFPSLMAEVAPHDYITALFGNFFTVEQLLGQGRTLGIFPGTTTVPVFVANTAIGTRTKGEPSSRENTCVASDAAICSDATNDNDHDSNSDHPVTGLHCEPIANLAVQLAGHRQWTLVDPHHLWRLQPAISADGRSFYPSWLSTDGLQKVPRFEVVTGPGDAIFVPTWTWHRVDYARPQQTLLQDNDNGYGTNDVSIGASLFHFRVGDFIRRNPLFAFLLVPAILGEAMGVSSQ